MMIFSLKNSKTLYNGHLLTAGIFQEPWLSAIERFDCVTKKEYFTSQFFAVYIVVFLDI